MATESVEDFLEQVSVSETRKRLQVGPELLEYLNTSSGSLECDASTADQLVEGLLDWLHSSNYKVGFMRKKELWASLY